MLTLVALSKR